MSLSAEARRKCQVSFVHFVAAMKPQFVFSHFSRSVCNDLQRFYVQTQKQEMPNLLLEAPPQHGKSWLCAELFPAWCLGINPNIRLGVSTYTSPLAEKRNIEIQRLIESPRYREIFPNTGLRQGNNIIEGARNSQEFEVIGHDGSLRAVGVGGSLTGFPLDIGVIDDPYKDMGAARSATQNAAVIEWYNSVFRTRMSKRSGVVMMLTRWAKNDLAGWAMENEQWTERKYRAIEDGAALVPFLHPIEQLERIKASLPEAIWQALYQQNPIIQGGNIIKEEWFQYYVTLPERWDRLFLVADTAQKTKEHNDYSVISAFGVAENNLYLLDMWRDKVVAPGLREASKRMWNKWHAGIGERPMSGFYIEDKSSGTGLIQDLAADSAIPIVPLQRTTDKYTRLMDVLNYIQSGRLYLPLNAPWVKDATDEMLAFSGDMKHEHDDIVDTIIDGLFIAFGPGMLSILDVI